MSFLGVFFCSCSHVDEGLKKSPSHKANTARKLKQVVKFTDDYYADYKRNFVAYKPEGWEWKRDYFVAGFWKPELIKFILLNQKTKAIITLRHGNRKDFGIPSYYDLDEPEAVYLSKLIRDGDFDKLVPDYKAKTNCFKKLWLLLYGVVYNSKPHGLAVMATFRGEFLYFEMLSPKASFERDLVEFKQFVDNITKVDKLTK